MKRLGGIGLTRPRPAAARPVHNLPLPALVRLPMLMHKGAPCVPAVAPGENVLVGQIVGRAEHADAVPVHSSVSGTVKALTACRLPDGKKVPCVDILTDGEQAVSPDCCPPELETKEDLVRAARESGCVGLGGSGDLTFRKLGTDRKISMLIVNGAECEPLLAADRRQMYDAPEEIIGGILLVMRLLKIKEARIGVAGDAPAAVQKLSELAAQEKGITVWPLPARYPQGAERVLIYHISGAEIPADAEPADAGFLTLNVSTLAFLYRFSLTGIPLVERIVTVGGNAVRNSANLRVPVGTPVQLLLETVGILPQEKLKVLCGGPMTGTALVSYDTPIVKAQNGLTVMKYSEPPKFTACMRCGRCLRACPLGLIPTDLSHAYLRQDTTALRRLHADYCMNCGCCTYVCPAKRPLAEQIQQAKVLLSRT